MTTKKRAWTASATLMLSLAISSPGSASTPAYCSHDLAAKSTSRTAYQERGDRCEGIYSQPVGDASMELHSFLNSFETFDPNTTEELVVAWSAPQEAAGQQVHVRALSLERNIRFRMDSRVVAAKGSFRWSTELLASVGPPPEQLAMVAWQVIDDSASLEHVYLPVSLGTRIPSQTQDTYEVILVPSRRLKEFHYQIFAVGGSGENKAVTARTDLRYGVYMAKQPIRFDFAQPDSAGLYRLAISTTTRDGATITEDYLFYHAAQPASIQGANR